MNLNPTKSVKIGNPEQVIGYRKLNELKGDNSTERAKSRMKKTTVQSPLLLRMGCG